MTNEQTTEPQISLDALLPPAMAVKAENIGVAKANLPLRKLVMLSLLAGAFIALGAAFSTNTLAGAQSLPYGIARLLAGVTFSLGLVLVIVGGAELFTGNNLLVMAWASGRIPTRTLLFSWFVSYLGNFAGALLTAILLFLAGQYLAGQGSVGAVALQIGNAKCSLGFFPAIVSGMLCNALVCLAVWLTLSARTTTDRMFCIVPPITTFVALGFEHSIANMYFIPLAILIRNHADVSFWEKIGQSPSSYAALTWERFFVGNLLPVTFGNLLGGVLLVGLVYWAVYRFPESKAPK